MLNLQDQYQSLLKNDSRFKFLLKLTGFLSFCIIILFLITLIVESLPSIQKFGYNFLLSSKWEPNKDNFGSIPFIIGTLLTSFLALAIAMPFSICIAVYLGFMIKNKRIKFFLQTTVDLLAGIPSVIYGFWGLMVLVPLIISFQTKLELIPFGVGIFTAALILAIMILPYSISLTKEVIELIPVDLKEAALSLGATPLDVIRFVIIPQAKSGIFAGQLMAFGRAVSETMAVTMVIGNRNLIPTSLFDPGNTLASVLANEFAEATGIFHISSLIQLALILFLMTISINIFGGYVMKKIK